MGPRRRQPGPTRRRPGRGLRPVPPVAWGCRRCWRRWCAWGRCCRGPSRCSAPPPLSEVPYFGVALLCVLVLSIADRRSGRGGLALVGAGASCWRRPPCRSASSAWRWSRRSLYVAVGGERLARVGSRLRRGRSGGADVCVGVADPAGGRRAWWLWSSAPTGTTSRDLADLRRSWGLPGPHRHRDAHQDHQPGGAGLPDEVLPPRATAAAAPAYVALGLGVAGLVVYGWLGRRRFGVGGGVHPGHGGGHPGLRRRRGRGSGSP